MKKQIVNKLRRVLGGSPSEKKVSCTVAEESKRRVTFQNAIPLELKVTPDSIHNFIYSTVRNAFAFSCLRSPDFYGYSFDIYKSAIKCYQDLLVLSFIRDTLPLGAKILDVGGAYSRILSHLSNDYECWCIDKYEGMGQGDVAIPGADCGFRVVVDYMGNFSADLPDNYFDLIFSISALEHGVQDQKVIQNIILDINRVLKTGGFSLHCIDLVIDKTNGSGGKLVHDEFFKVAHHKLPAYSDMLADKDLYILPENIFDSWNMGMPYSDICIVDTCAFWVRE